MQFVSKRNTVCRRGEQVFKQVSTEAAARLEADFLLSLRAAGVAVPGGVQRRGCLIVMDYVQATPLPDLLDRPTEEGDLQEVAQALVAWLSDFYRAVDHRRTGEIRGDVNGRNFLIEGGAVCGVDFEEHSFGRMEQDIGRLLAFVQTYTVQDPSSLERLHRAILQQALQQLSLDRALVLQEEALELQAMELRRKK